MFPPKKTSMEQMAQTVFFVTSWFVLPVGNTHLALLAKTQNAALLTMDTNFNKFAELNQQHLKLELAAQIEF
jgi:uncharacterized protein YacL